jgi:hypothetical protein
MKLTRSNTLNHQVRSNTQGPLKLTKQVSSNVSASSKNIKKTARVHSRGKKTINLSLGTITTNNSADPTTTLTSKRKSKKSRFSSLNKNSEESKKIQEQPHDRNCALSIPTTLQQSASFTFGGPHTFANTKTNMDPPKSSS